MKKTLGFGIVSVMLGLVLLAFCASDAYGIIFKKSNIADMSYGTIEEGDVAEGDLQFVVTKLGTREESRHLFFIPLGSQEAAYYLIADNGGYVTIDVRTDISDFDEIAAQTAEYLAGNAGAPTVTHRFIGRADEISDEQLALLRAHFEEINLSESDWEFAVSSMVLTELDVTLTVIELCICFGLILIGIILLLISRRYRFGETVFVGEKVPGEEDADGKEKPEKTDSEDDDKESDGADEPEEAAAEEEKE